MKTGFFFFGFLLAALSSCENYEDLVNDPQPGDIYILEENDVYYPMKVDSVAKEEIYMVNSKFVFTDAVPRKEDLPESDFDHSWHLIYKADELKRLFREDKIIRVYRSPQISGAEIPE